nr:reverse transcriptase domain-containing protein [Tanacetum cinerariifolium]
MDQELLSLVSTCLMLLPSLLWLGQNRFKRFRNGSRASFLGFYLSYASSFSSMARLKHSLEHRLNVREGCPPVRQKKRGQAHERTKAIQAEVEKLVEARIMREVYYHDWLSNPVMVKKHDGSWRMCVDFTNLNKACPQDCYPLPEIDWKVESLYAYKGYHQIQMAAADEEKTAFHTRHGVYCYTKMPFGLKNAGATYQRLMDKAFENQMGRNIEVYVDNLVVKSHTEAEMVRDIKKTFQTLRKINMKLNPKKCSFGLAEGVFLGYVITPEGIKPCPNKTTAVLQLPSPQTIKEDCYPLPEIDWKVESLCGYPFKCFLDAYKGYHQIQLTEADEEKTAFHTGHGVYCYTKIPFGLKNAGATYQRLMDKAFESQMGRNIEVYVDDLVVKSHTEAEMVRDIEKTFQTLRKINMKLNPKKCSFGLAKGVFLGYVITPEGIKPCPDKTTTVLQLPSPQTIKEVQSLNGKLASLNRTSVPAAETAFIRSPSIGRTETTGRADHRGPDDRTGGGPDANLLYKPCITGSEIKLFTDGKTGFITGLRSKKTSKIFSGTSYHGNTSQGAPVAVTQEEPWTLFTDGSSCVDGSGAGLILTNPEGVEFTYALRFQFVASNDEAEYEALIAGLRIATQMGVKNIQANVDSKLVANQVLGTYVAKEDNMIKYLEITKGLVSGFKTFSISQVPRSRNKKADALSKIASTSFTHLSKQVLVEVLETKSITGKEVTAVIEEEGPTWMTELVNYLKEGILPGDEKEARKLRLKARQYELMEGVLYKRSFLTPWLRCVGPLQAEYVMKEIHEGSCSMHAGPRSVVAKPIRLGYFWPTMHKDARDMIRKCGDCQIHRPVTRHPQQPLTPITAPWPFYKWGIDIAGPFPEGTRKVKFLIVAMDYFTKWIEAKAVATITGGHVKKFVWDNIVCRFGIPGEIISDNGKQFADNPFKDWCDKLNITQRFASVKHLQSNGLVERANRSLGEGIKARLGVGNKNRVEELPHVLWAHRTMIKSSHGDTPFSLTYGTEAIIPAEIGMPTYRTTAMDVVNNDEELRLNLDLLEERRELTEMSEANTTGGTINVTKLSVFKISLRSRVHQQKGKTLRDHRGYRHRDAVRPDMMCRANPVSTAYYAAFFLLFGTTYICYNSIRQFYLLFVSPRVSGVTYLRVHGDGELRGAGAEVAYILWGIPPVSLSSVVAAVAAAGGLGVTGVLVGRFGQAYGVGSKRFFIGGELGYPRPVLLGVPEVSYENFLRSQTS